VPVVFAMIRRTGLVGKFIAASAAGVIIEYAAQYTTAIARHKLTHI
jgi:hypothetical protein